MRYLIVKKEYGLKYSWRKTIPTIRQYIMFIDYKRVLWTSM